ncbi:hypothetical protein QVD17_30211 [Tagetes erecta]|uniref:Uncharacterized protein n=1 Tax=Tagetes erecta TaxID=13708 RepID=A0AAD8NMT9_TARER|nr:hypothetical protein QVD17_30211 [Tagetes erecta]
MARVIRAIHESSRVWPIFPCKNSIFYPWKAVIKVVGDLEELDNFPSLLRPEMLKNCQVGDRFEKMGNNWKVEWD